MPTSKYKLFLTPAFTRDLKTLDPEMRERVEEALVRLLNSPFSGRKLKNVPYGQWRIRVGDYRIRYDIEKESVILHRVRHRKDIYK